MRTIAPTWIALWLLVPVAMAQSPAALRLPPTLQSSDSKGVESGDVAIELEDLQPESEANELQLKDFIVGLEVTEVRPDDLDFEFDAVQTQPISGEGLEVIASDGSRRTGESPATVRDVRPSSHDESLGEKIRSRANVAYEGIDLGTAGNDDEGPADPLDDENAFDKGYFNDIDAGESRIRSALSHLKELRRPVSTIHIEFGSQGDETPANLARLLVGQEAPTLITASGATIPLPDRYTIGFAHRPLYYEELDLERCGLQHGCLQYEVSGFYFLLNTLVLPYRMATQCPGDLVCTRGDCKSCQYYPCEIERLGINKRAIIAETAAIAGFTFLLL